jgi:hypothetical protein
MVKAKAAPGRKPRASKIESEVDSEYVHPFEDDSVIEERLKRLDRHTEARSFSSRTLQERPPLVLSRVSVFNVPKEVQDSDPDHIYGFVPYLGNDDQSQNPFERAMEEEYWKPVERNEHPILARRYSDEILGRTHEFSKYVRRRGQILVKRPKDVHKARLKEYENELKHQQDSQKHMKFWDKSRTGTWDSRMTIK